MHYNAHSFLTGLGGKVSNRRNLPADFRKEEQVHERRPGENGV